MSAALSVRHEVHRQRGGQQDLELDMKPSVFCRVGLRIGLS